MRGQSIKEGIRVASIQKEGVLTINLCQQREMQIDTLTLASLSLGSFYLRVCIYIFGVKMIFSFCNFESSNVSLFFVIYLFIYKTAVFVCVILHYLFLQKRFFLDN